VAEEVAEEEAVEGEVVVRPTAFLNFTVASSTIATLEKIAPGVIPIKLSCSTTHLFK
jgi:hypothetical protein